MKIKKILVVQIVLLLCLASLNFGEESLFTADIVQRALTKKVFAFIETNKETIIEDWIFLTEIPAPSGFEEKRADLLKKKFEDAGLDKVYIDEAGNVVGIWIGTEKGKNIVVPAHLDTVFQDLWEIKVKREGNVLKAPGVGDDTASLIHLVWSVRALKSAGFKPENTYYFVATVGGRKDFLACVLLWKILLKR